MLTRRRTVAGLLTVALGSAAVTSGAFLSNTAAGADLRVVVVSDLRLTLAREDMEEYVRTDAEGEVEAIVIEKLNQRSVSTFADLVEVTNNGDVTYDRLAFEFVAGDDAPNGENAAAAETLEVTSESETGTDQQGRTTLLGDGTESLAPGDAVAFGIVVNLIASSTPGDLDDLPDDTEVVLEITAIRE